MPAQAIVWRVAASLIEAGNPAPSLLLVLDALEHNAVRLQDHGIDLLRNLAGMLRRVLMFRCRRGEWRVDAAPGLCARQRSDFCAARQLEERRSRFVLASYKCV
jgi:hypothetical protein